MKTLDPRSPNPERKLCVPTLPSLRGKRLAFLNNGWLSMEKIGKLIEGRLLEDYGVREIVFHSIPRNMEPPGGLLDQVARDFDAAIVGLAN